MRLAVWLLAGVLYAQGQAGEEPWRAEALQRIEKLRKADVKVEVTDARGRPVGGAQVHVRMKRHAFGWGSAVAAQMLLAETPDSEKYRKFVLDNFNTVVFENDLKWPQWEQNRQRALDGIQWMRDHGITRIRGHNLVWPSWRWLPKDLRGLEDDPGAMRRRVMDHIKDEVTATRGLVPDWDVLNEPYTNHDIMDILGAGEMVAWFKQAREYDPAARLFLNDFNIIAAKGQDTEHQNHFFETLKFVRERGAPLDGVGIQGHFREPTPPERMLKILDRFGTLGLPIHITEFDFDTKGEAAQAQFTRDLLITCFSHPKVEAFLMWGFWEGRHWRPNGAMLRRDWSPKPNYEVWRELVFGKWWTDEKGAVNADGVFHRRAFLGDYEIGVTHGGRTAKASAPVGPGGTTVKVVLN
ncbi:MAG: endo-1,4-beta-xylanase [Candidatus Solibacter usitatus]|nr:endo-1,4-beta-xylanase [Candidatus Solibacter usitatus]